ncbi:hypothetical protein DL89DRAFT_101088 [Linderina pennispora]|uniref:Uncharacterized protein n=1 Tax=Linderina pennispora TaxID=61395 RepID=A0A1Y1VWU3_9FUNG|nr:uncharacterized protein DL89DRAFT_101088 [Linderina pennispora]ORX65456.1 hypothetical protein DL89DRAFT_101088 [Linderina pennispora]
MWQVRSKQSNRNVACLFARLAPCIPELAFSLPQICGYRLHRLGLLRGRLSSIVHQGHWTVVAAHCDSYYCNILKHSVVWMGARS